MKKDRFLINKKILFISPSFFGYEYEIKKKLECFGATVDMYDDRPTNHSIGKIIIRKSPKLFSVFTHKYYKKIIDNSKSVQYDYIFFIKCETPLEKDLINLKKENPQATFIWFLYDSINNIKYYTMKKKYFDYIYSFDLKDCRDNDEMIFRPLFYLDCYKKINSHNSPPQYDYCFIGSSHSDRCKIINHIYKQLTNKETFYFRIYVPSIIIYFWKFIVDKNFRELRKANIITRQKISSKEVSEIYKKSLIIIDIQHPLQTGLTMRTIELLGLNKKMLTTNTYINNYDFYKENNIRIIDRNNFKLTRDFLSCVYSPIEKDIYDYYSIDNWIKDIFGKMEVLS